MTKQQGVTKITDISETPFKKFIKDKKCSKLIKAHKIFSWRELHIYFVSYLIF